jgi:hypothetical protein
MKKYITSLLALTGAAFVIAPTVSAETHKPAGSPVVITPAAIPNGSNWSRAPFLAARPQNDATPPNGEAFDQNVPPNTPSTTPEPFAPPPATVAILQPRVQPGVEPGLMPTGRPTSAASAALADAQMQPAIRNATFESRAQLIDDLRSRLRQSEATVREFRRSESQMSASGRSQFDALSSEEKTRRKALEHSLRAAADASSADWEQARAQLASDYDAYAGALASLDAAVGVTPVR